MTRSSALEDRLSELPDTLILHIFKFLPITDVVRTTIISSRWKDLWTTIPSLIFFDSKLDNPDRLWSFVNGFIKFWRGNTIIRFWVHLVINKSAFIDVDSWVRFAYENGVEDLHLSITYEEEEGEEYWLPQYLYSCSSLKQLAVEGCNVEINGKVQWNRLKSLEILHVCLDETDVNQILLGSPQLEALVLCVEESGRDDSLSIRSSSLQLLVIEKLVVNYADKSMDSQLRIWTPNLKKLRMWGFPYCRYLLEDISSLTLANLGFDGPLHHEFDLCPWNDFLWEGLRYIFSAIQHVEKVVVSDWCIQVLGAATGNSLFSPCPNVKILKLKGCLEEYEQILGLLEMFPNLTRLILEAEQDVTPVRAGNAESFSDFLAFHTNSFLSQLRTVKVSWIKGDTSFYPLMELVLKYASQLEKVEFRKRLDYMTSDVEVSSFCIAAGTADCLTKILTKMQS